jgi:hypothetical protein
VATANPGIQQGIEYGYVGGDPAELMKLSVDHGMFTVSFMKEGLQKVVPHTCMKMTAFDFFITVPWLVGRPAEDFLGGMSRYRCVGREPKRDERLPHRRGTPDTLFSCLYHDLD